MKLRSVRVYFISLSIGVTDSYKVNLVVMRERGEGEIVDTNPSHQQTLTLAFKKKDSAIT